MKIGVISDTHDQYENIVKTVKILNEKTVKLTIHCGDWISPFTLAFYKELQSPIKGVFGNNDGDRFLHAVRAKDFGLNIEYQERVLKLKIDDRSLINKTVGKTLSLNPGTLMPVTSDKVKGASFAIYDTTSNSAEVIKL